MLSLISLDSKFACMDYRGKKETFTVGRHWHMHRVLMNVLWIAYICCIMGAIRDYGEELLLVCFN